MFSTIVMSAMLVMILSVTAESVSAQGGPYQRQRIDQAAATRGRGVYTRSCANCHGSAAKGTERGRDLIRSVVGSTG